MLALRITAVTGPDVQACIHLSHAWIIEDHLDRRVRWIDGVGKLEAFDEFVAAMAVCDQRMDFAADEVDAGQQADRAVALVFIVAREAGMRAGHGGQVVTNFRP
jgi:hypothetical protein